MPMVSAMALIVNLTLTPAKSISHIILHKFYRKTIHNNKKQEKNWSNATQRKSIQI